MMSDVSYGRVTRNAARELAAYVVEQNADIARVNKTAKANGSTYRITPIKYTYGFKPVFLAYLWETGARYEAERKVQRYDTKAIH